MNPIKLLSYKDFFGTEPASSKIDYARTLGKDILYRTASHFLSFYRLDIEYSNEDLFKEWFTFYDLSYDKSPSYQYVIEQYQKLQKANPGFTYEFLYVETFLKLFEWLRTVDIKEPEKKPDASVTLTLFKLVLLFNDESLVNMDHAFSSIDKDDPFALQKRWLATMFPQHDLVNANFEHLVYCQFYKAMVALQFLETNPKYKDLNLAFLTLFKSNSKENYIQRLFPLIMQVFANKNKGWSIVHLGNKENDDTDREFLDLLSIKDTNTAAPEQNDYLSIRSNPLRKIDDTDYMVIFDLFLLKKAYNGLVFKLSELVTSDPKLLAGSFFGEFRGDFSEGELMYKILASTFTQNGAVHFTGNELKKNLGREPDYYLRIDEKIFLFESKDFYILGASKLSYDFDIISNELKYPKGDTTSKPDRLLKAVIQLTKNVERCLVNEIPNENTYAVGTPRIYPVICVHDGLYSTPSLNFWVNTWYQDKLEMLKQDARFAKTDWSTVAPVTIVEIDTLIVYHCYFAEGAVNFAEMLDYFHEAATLNVSPYSKQDPAASSQSFAEFFAERMNERGMRPRLDLITSKLREFGVK